MQAFEQLLSDRVNKFIDECRDVKDSFSKSSESLRQAYLSEIIARRDALLDRVLSTENHLLPSYSDKLLRLEKSIKKYAGHCNWNFVDLTFFLACMNEVDSSILEQIAKASLTYQAYRMIDDLIDEHMDYKGKGQTLYQLCKLDHELNLHLVSATILPALIMICEGLKELDRNFADCAIKTVKGVLIETLGNPIETVEQYTAMVDGKMVAYGMLLYGPALQMIDRQITRQVTSLMRETFLCSQIANDLFDRDDDAQRGQPNFWNILDPNEAFEHLMEKLSILSAERFNIPAKLNFYFTSRLYDICKYIIQGLNKIENP